MPLKQAAPARGTEYHVDRLVANIAARLECHVNLIRSARDPMAMLETLRPILVHPRVNGGEIPAAYLRIAEDEVRRRCRTETQH